MGRIFDIRLTGLREPFVVHADPQEEDLLDLRLRRLLKPSASDTAQQPLPDFR